MHDPGRPGVESARARPGRPLTDAEADRLARRYVAAYNDQDLEAMLALLDEQVTIHPSPLFERRPHYAGHTGVREWWETMVASGRWYEVGIAEVRRMEEDRWAIVGEIRDGADVLSPWVVLLRVRNALIIESRSYLSDEGLLDAGLLR
jgi:hypothetical protein